MHVHNESYENKIMRLRYEMLLMHSKTGQACGLDKAVDFDSALNEVSRPETLRTDEVLRPETLRRPIPRRQVSSGNGTLMSDIEDLLSERARRMRKNTSVRSESAAAARSDVILIGNTQTYWRNDLQAGRDTVIAEVAQQYAQAMDISGNHDTVFVAPA